MSIRARVSLGRLVVDEPVDLPEGTVLDLVVDDEGDELDDDERRAPSMRDCTQASSKQRKAHDPPPGRHSGGPLRAALDAFAGCADGLVPLGCGRGKRAHLHQSR